MRLAWGGGSDCHHFIQAHLPVGRAVFVFGEVQRSRHPYNGALFRSRHPYNGALFQGMVLARSYSVEHPEGVEGWVNLRTVWPISEDFFEKARKVGWDLSDPSAPIEELEEAMRQFRRENPGNGA